MADRIELNELELDGVVGGALKWLKTGIVYPKDNPNVQFSYTDYYQCAAWLVANWNTIQDEKCLIAMEEAGLVHRI